MGFFSFLRGAFRFGTRTAVLLTFVVMLALNVATLTVSAVSAAVSTAASAVGITTVAARQSAELASKGAAIATAKARQAAQMRAAATARQAAQRKVVRRIAARASRGAIRSASSSFAQGIPFAGAAVIAGITAWEIHDACETMKDAAELAGEVDAETDATQVCGMEVPSATEITTAVLHRPKELWDGMRNEGLSLPDWSPDWRLPFDLPETRWLDYWPFSRPGGAEAEAGSDVQ